MSEKIYALLLRLYPAHFRRFYTGEALQLFRDRLRDEPGFFPRLRLWLDLLFDLAVSLPREHRALRPAVEIAPARQPLAGMPSFGILEPRPPRAAAVVVAATLSLGGTAAFFLLLNHAGVPLTTHLSSAENRAQARPAAMGTPPTLSPSGANFSVSSNTGNASALATGTPPAPPDRQAAAPSTVSILPGGRIDDAERQRVIAVAARDLKAFYFDRAIGEQTAAALLAQQDSADDKAANQGSALAALLTHQMREASHDMHLIVEYSARPLPTAPPAPTPADQARYREAMLSQNCMFRKVAVLLHNIGYLKLDFFPDTSVCQPTATAAMASLNHVDALIFDLRDNTGGFPDMVSFIAAYLFDHPVYLYSPRDAPSAESWTHSPVPGSLLADKPVYILTSSSTWSGAEQFSYDLKMLKRATLVGETTRGGAHAGVFHRIDDHFGMGIPESRPVNPYSDHDWEGVGVAPEVKVKAADALSTAQDLALRNLRHPSPAPQGQSSQ
jgi:Peptidase family S41